MNRLVQCLVVLSSALALGSAPAVSVIAEQPPKPELPRYVTGLVAGRALRPLMISDWTLAPGPYEVKCDDLLGPCSMPLLRSRAGAGGETTGTLAHSEPAAPWAGATVAFKAELRAGQVDGAATLWLLAEDEAGRVLAFADTRSTALKGSTSFEVRTVTLDVPHRAAKVRFGIALEGAGAVFIREAQLRDVTEHPGLVRKEPSAASSGAIVR